jgi:hypothetical protein
MSICDFAGATSGPYRNLPYNIPKPKVDKWHPRGFIMKRTDYDYSQIKHFCPPCSDFFIPITPINPPISHSYSCEGGECVLQHKPPGPLGYFPSMSQCQQNCHNVNPYR